MEGLAEFLRNRRDELGLSRAAAAKLMGISDDYLGIIEEGYHRVTGKPSEPSPAILRKIASGYSISYPKLLDLAGYLPEGVSGEVLEMLCDPRNKAVLEMMNDHFEFSLLVSACQAIVNRSTPKT